MISPSDQAKGTFSKELLIYYPFIFITFTFISVVATLYPVEVSLFTHVLFPILVMAFLGMLTRFGYIKLTSLIGGRSMVILAALGWGDASIHWVYLVFLQLNILEAALLDGYRKNYFNAASGFLLLGSSFYLVLGWTGSYLIIENESYIPWVLAYTVWNANFVTLQLSGAYFTHHYLLLLSPLFACLAFFDFSYWLILREASLLLGIAILSSFKVKLQHMEHQAEFVYWFEKIRSILQKPRTQTLLFSIVSLLIFIHLIAVN
ncbi:MAG: hypothetical protein AAFQ01_02690 [Bacteroidota bacterium]